MSAGEWAVALGIALIGVGLLGFVLWILELLRDERGDR